MKNKKMLYILIPGTLIVWGMIIYKIVMNVNSGDNPVVSKGVAMVANDEALSDTFSINPTYRDPFLGKVQHVSISNDEGVKSKVVTPTPVVAVNTPWPNIVYIGIIKNQKLKKEMVMMEINGQSYSMKVGETVGNVILSKAFPDSVEVQFLKEKKFIHK